MLDIAQRICGDLPAVVQHWLQLHVHHANEAVGFLRYTLAHEDFAPVFDFYVACGQSVRNYNNDVTKLLQPGTDEELAPHTSAPIAIASIPYEAYGVGLAIEVVVDKLLKILLVIIYDRQIECDLSAFAKGFFIA